MPSSSDLLKLGLATGAGVIASGLASPEEAEGASVTKSALDWAAQQWRKANFGKVVTPEQMEKAGQWAFHDVPKTMKTATVATDSNDAQILREALHHPDFPNLNPESINTLRRSQAAIPERVQSTLDPTIKFMEGEHPALRGRYIQKGDYTSGILYNPISPAENLINTPGHEWTHGVTLGKGVRPLIPEAINENLAQTRSIDNQVNLLRKKQAFEKTQGVTSTAGVGDDHDLYFNMPGEIAARKMGEIVAEHSKTPEGTSFIRDINNYFRKLNEVSVEANKAASFYSPSTFKAGMEKYKDFLTAGGIATGGVLAGASPSQAMSNIDKTPGGTPGYRMGNIDHNEVAKGFFGEEARTPSANIMLGDPGEGLISPFVKKVGEALVSPLKHVAGMIGDTVKGMSEIGGALQSNKAAREYMETHAVTDPIGVMADISGGSALSPGVSSGFGAIQMKGFFSSLTNVLESGVIGKSVLTPKMSGNQMLKTLESGGIKLDELKFSGVGQKLAEIGDDRIGPTLFEELKGTAKEGALGFSKKEMPGVHAGYSLFPDHDPSFKTATYSYPGVEFDESHFGKGVVAHRRFGDKEVSTAPRYDEQLRTGMTTAGNALSRENFSSLHLDEVQSQFYEQGSKFGHGSPKVPVATSKEGDVFTSAVEHFNDDSDFSRNEISNLTKDYPGITENAKRYNDLGYEASIITRDTPQGFARGLAIDAEQYRIFNQYHRPQDRSVENAPLRGEKYVELLAKDHLRDALASGKDAISWTPSEVQHERYYGKGALGSMGWEFNPGKTGSNGSTILIFHGGEPYVGLSNIEDLKNHAGSEATKKLLEDLQSGKTSGTLEGNAKEVFQKLYDRSIPKAFEKLTGEKPRKGWVKGRNGEDVEINWIPLDKAKEKLVKPGWIPADQPIVPGMIKVKELPIASASQAVNDFFSGGMRKEKENGVTSPPPHSSGYGLKDVLNEVAWG